MKVSLAPVVNSVPPPLSSHVQFISFKSVEEGFRSVFVLSFAVYESNSSPCAILPQSNKGSTVGTFILNKIS